MSKLIAEVMEVKASRNDNGLIVHLQAPVIDPFGKPGTFKYVRFYESIPDTVQTSMIGSKVSFDEDKVNASKFTLPEDHEYAGTVITKYWIKGDVELVK